MRTYELSDVPRPRWRTKLAHPTYIIESCTNCGFPEADGGYCEECGTTFHSPDCPCRFGRPRRRRAA